MARRYLYAVLLDGAVIVGELPAASANSFEFKILHQQLPSSQPATGQALFIDANRQRLLVTTSKGDVMYFDLISREALRRDDERMARVERQFSDDQKRAAVYSDVDQVRHESSRSQLAMFHVGRHAVRGDVRSRGGDQAQL